MIGDYPTVPEQPIGLIMPETAQIIFTFGNLVPLAIVALIAIRYARANKTLIPIAMLIGGGLCFLIEPVVDVLGLCYFPHTGSWGIFRAFNVTLPAFMLPVYMWFVGGQAFLVFRMLENGMSRVAMFRVFGSIMVVNGLLETPGLLIGVYTYYGAQPFQLLGFPWWWTLCNAAMPMAVAVAAFSLRNHLQGAKAWLLVPIIPMIDGATNGAIGWPVWLALNSGIGYLVTYPAALISAMLALIFIYILSIIVAAQSTSQVNSDV